MDKIRKLVAAGVSVTTAIREVLGMSDAAFAAKYSLNRAVVNNHIGGRVRATEETVDALVQELGGTRQEWREVLWLAGKPDHV